MRTYEVLDLEDLCLDEGPDMMAAMALPDLRHYLEEVEAADEDLGLRALLETPEALSDSFQRELQ